MATFGEIVYSVLDILKEHADDAYYTEEHVIFLASKIRALLLERKYKNTRNSTFNPMSDENMQEICIDLEPATILPDGCSGMWLTSVQDIPETLNVAEPKLYFAGDVIHSMVTYIPVERMPYVGYNKWLRNIIYAAKSRNGHLYLNGGNPQFMYLKRAKMSAVFADPLDAVNMTCGSDNEGKCDVMKAVFPLEQALVPSCIELVVQELIGSRYAPEDKDNNAKDDLGAIGVTQQRHPRPVENSRSKTTEET